MKLGLALEAVPVFCLAEDEISTRCAKSHSMLQHLDLVVGD